MAFQFPNWPRTRLLREPAFAWNLRNPDNRCDPFSSDWPFVCSVVLAYLRHSLTDYDGLVEAETRAALRAQIQTAARRQYPWLRPETDPRQVNEQGGNGQTPGKILNEASAQLAELFSVRAQILETRRLQRDKTKKRLFEQKIKDIETLIQKRQELFQTFPHPDNLAGPDTRFIIWDHPTPRYAFGCRQLSPNYIEEAGFKCPRCEKTVMRTKRSMDLGAGIKLSCLSCECLSIAVSPEYAKANLKAWTTLLEPGEREGEVNLRRQ